MLLFPSSLHTKEEKIMMQNKSKALYPHPFSKAYWRDAVSEMKDTRMLVVAALMIALRVALKFVYIPLAPNLKINTAFIANALGAMIFGPVMATVAAIASDFLGVILSGDTYFPPFVLTEIAGSLIFALCLYRARINTIRVMIARFSICFFVNVLLQTPLMILYYSMVLGKTGYVLTIPHVLKNLFMFPIETVVLALFLNMMMPITCRMGLTYDTKANLKFDKKEIIALAITFVIGCGCVFAYLNYYYETTSLSASYTAAQRYEANTKMTEALRSEVDGYEDITLVTTVDSAYKKFLGDVVTYNVVIYQVDEAAAANYSKDLEEIRGMSKSKAKAVAEDGVMTQIGTATVILNEKTNQVVLVDVQ